MMLFAIEYLIAVYVQFYHVNLLEISLLDMEIRKVKMKVWLRFSAPSAGIAGIEQS